MKESYITEIFSDDMGEIAEWIDTIFFEDEYEEVADLCRMKILTMHE